MFHIMKVRLIVALIMIPITLVACESRQTETVMESQPETVIMPEGPVFIPNPAATYCTGMGYKLVEREFKTDKQEPQAEISPEPTPETREGPEPGIPVVPEYMSKTVCVFPDGNECEEWDFMLGRCGQEHSYCEQRGYTLEPGDLFAICAFPDGSSCPEFDYFNGDCTPGKQGESSE